MGKGIVGRDAAFYTVTPGGPDVINNGFVAGTEFNFLGQWKSIEFTYEREWLEVTTSAGDLKERRRTTRDWKGSATHLVRSGNARAFALAMVNDYIMVKFQDSVTGAMMTAIGGIDRSSIKDDDKDSNETIEFLNIGPYNGGESLFYSS